MRGERGLDHRGAFEFDVLSAEVVEQAGAGA